MKKIFLAVMAFVSLHTTFAQQAAKQPTPKEKSATIKSTATTKATNKSAAVTTSTTTKTTATAKTPEKAPANTSANGVVLKKDGTPDKRYKNNAATGPLKKDGTPDLRYKANKKG